MQKIVFFTPSLKIGGVERVFITYADALVRLGYEVTYVVCRDGGELLPLLPPEMKIVSLGNRPLRKSIFSLIRFFRNNEVDVFITGGDISNAISLIASKIARSKAKVIISHHNYFNLERSSLVSRVIIRYLYNWASKVVSVSAGITDLLLKSGVHEEKVVTIYNPVDLEQIANGASMNREVALPASYLLFLGRMGEIKNLPFLMDSFKLLEKKYPAMDLVFVGEGPMQCMLEEKAKALNLTGKVHFLGVLPNPYHIIENAEAVILPSFSEALPTVVLESFAFGKTVISTPTNGAVDLLENGRLGYLSESFDNAEAFASLIERGLLCPISADLLKLKVQQFTVDKKVKELEELF